MLTRNSKSKKRSSPGAWKLQDAKTHFSEVVRRARSQGPQRVTVHGKDAVVIVDAAEFAKLNPEQPNRTGAELVAVMQEGRRLGLKLKPLRYYPAVRPPPSFSGDDE